MVGREWRRESVTVDGDRAWSLFCACADGDESEVQSLIGQNTDLNYAEIQYLKPIEYAIREGHVDIVRHLLDNDPHRWLWSSVYSGPFSIGRREVRHRGYDELDRLLLGYKLEQAPRYTPQFEELSRHMQAHDLDQVKSVLRSQDLLHASDLEGDGPLHRAVRCNAFDIVEFLVEAGVDLEAENGHGATALDLSCLYGSDATPFLLARDARWTLSAAARVGHLDRAKAILQEDPDLARRLDVGQRAPLTHAAAGGHLEVVQLLFDKGADPNMPERDAFHGAALFEAAARDRRAVVDFLLENGANPNAYIDSWGTSVEIAKSDVVQQSLRKHGAFDPVWSLDANQMKRALREGKPGIRDDDESLLHGGWGSFAHHVCGSDVELLDLYVTTVGTDRLHELDSLHSLSNDPAFVDRLNAHGVNPNNLDCMGRSYLHWAADGGHVGVLERYLDHGAEINAVDLYHSTTPLGYAARKGDIASVRLLLEKGADPKLPADRGWAQPLTYAELEGHAAVVEVLRSV